jgi:hypothetical protein
MGIRFLVLGIMHGLIWGTIVIFWSWDCGFVELVVKEESFL